MTEATRDRQRYSATAIMPWLSVADARDALAFYEAAFGARRGEVAEFDGVVEVAELVVGEVSFWVQSEANLPPAMEPSQTARAVIVVADPAGCFDGDALSTVTTLAERGCERSPPGTPCRE